MIITIDGPAGAGKSSAARSLAERLGFRVLDTGAMYRAVTWAALQRDVVMSDGDALAQLANDLDIRLQGDQVFVDGIDVTVAIRAPEVADAVHFIADQPRVRARLVELQQQVAAQGDFVAEGRDQGTVVFPQAPCKFFVTASDETRALRRHQELRERGLDCSLEEVAQQQRERDIRDASRPVGRLYRAPDAVEIQTDGLTAEEVVELLHQHVAECLSRSTASSS